MNVSACLPCRLSRGPLKRELLDIYLSTSFVVGNFGNTKAMSVIFFWKCSKFHADWKKAQIYPNKMLCFWDKYIWIVLIHLSLLMREYLSSAVNVLRKGLKNWHVSMSDFCNLITFTVIIQDDKGTLIKIESVYGSVYHVACPEAFSNERV